jgi:hypothetical protein
MHAPESAFIGNASTVSFPAEVATYVPSPETNAHQCLVLRLLALKWANGILSRFQQVAGQKFAHAVGHDVMTQVQPWGWEIFLENGLLRDDHFFPRVAAATHAYRAIFMGLGAQMGFAIGPMLTQRILSEMFYELDGEERAVLSAHRLIPAAFSE